MLLFRTVYFSVFSFFSVFAQAALTIENRAVEGYVYNDNSTPIYRATIKVKGSEISVQTNKNGYFKLENISDGAALIFSYLNFKPLEVTISGTSVIQVRLSSSVSSIISGAKTPFNEPQEYGEEIFTTVEQNPEFVGGVSKMYQYLASNIRTPGNSKTVGKVFLKFVVEKDGSISKIELLKGLGKECDEGAIRLISEMPKWNAGKQNGRPVRVYYTLPILFK